MQWLDQRKALRKDKRPNKLQNVSLDKATAQTMVGLRITNIGVQMQIVADVLALHRCIHAGATGNAEIHDARGCCHCLPLTQELPLVETSKMAYISMRSEIQATT